MLQSSRRTCRVHASWIGLSNDVMWSNTCKTVGDKWFFMSELISKISSLLYYKLLNINLKSRETKDELNDVETANIKLHLTDHVFFFFFFFCYTPRWNMLLNILTTMELTHIFYVMSGAAALWVKYTPYTEGYVLCWA